MRSNGLMFRLFAFVLLSVVFMACGGGGPKTDVDINARILDIRVEERVIRVSDLGAGRHWEMRLTDATEIEMGGEKASFADLKKGFHVRIWANNLTGEEIKFEVVKIVVTDSGEGAPLRR
ncbi:MAG: hypothetical protein JXA74_03255 [Anaerolineae bacterium]|nr:hypothetical protein [Anaerolineae bacterium]